MTEELLANAYIQGASDLLQGKIEGIPKVVVIPDNATNGDMMKVMFDVEIKHIFEDLNVVVIVLDGKTKVFDLDWWNTSYKGE